MSGQVILKFSDLASALQQAVEILRKFDTLIQLAKNENPNIFPEGSANDNFLNQLQKNYLPILEGLHKTYLEHRDEMDENPIRTQVSKGILQKYLIPLLQEVYREFNRSSQVGVENIFLVDMLVENLNDRFFTLPGSCTYM